jgi:NAD(P)-dependent dehydrogenase (short-subunit alcohol dehydrogenase family)
MREIVMAKTILITGASSGIGRACAQHFANSGWNVVATMRNPVFVDALSAFPNVLVEAMDVTDELSVRDALARSVQVFGRIDVLVNNAGYGLFGAVESLTAEQVSKQIDTNVNGVLRTMRHVIPLMRAQGSGLIINMSSIAGCMTFPFTSVYHATKYAVEGLSESARFELAQHGIAVKLIEPGGVKTNFNNTSLTFAEHAAYEPQLSNYRRLLKDDRSWAQPEQIAAIIYKAATDNRKKLRYLAKPGVFFFLRRLMTDRMWLAFGRLMLGR